MDEMRCERSRLIIREVWAKRKGELERRLIKLSIWIIRNERKK